MPASTASLVITMDPSAITIPQDRSMPAVRMITVCPMAMTPTTITCCRMSEKFCPVRKRSVCDAKNAHAASSARNGPNVAIGIWARVLRGSTGFHWKIGFRRVPLGSTRFYWVQFYQVQQGFRVQVLMGSLWGPLRNPEPCGTQNPAEPRGTANPVEPSGTL